MIKLSDAHILILEDDGAMLRGLHESFAYVVQAIYPFAGIDEANESLIDEDNARYISVYIIDIMLPLPRIVKLPPDTHDIEAGLVYHGILEKRLQRALPVVFFTGATKNNIEMEKEVRDYVSKAPLFRKYVAKPASIEQLIRRLHEVLEVAS